MSSHESPARIRVLDAAWKALAENAGGTLKMSDMAKAAGISRQALYLHFPSRAELLIALTRHIDAAKDIDGRLAASRAATTGRDRLREYIQAWGSYIPEIHAIAHALIAMKDSDEAAQAAWADRMAAMRHGCAAAVDALARDGDLVPTLTPTEATDFLWTLLSVENWESLTQDCGWSQDAYLQRMIAFAEQVLVRS